MGPADARSRRSRSASCSTATSPDADHGDDVDEAGNGTLADQRLYQLIRQADTGGDRLFEIEFLAAGAEAYCFTFG